MNYPNVMSSAHLRPSARVDNLRSTGRTVQLRATVGKPTEAASCSGAAKVGADDRNRTGDLVLTKDALCQLSYIGLRAARFGRQVGRTKSLLPGLPAVTRSASSPGLPAVARSTSSERRLERETGIEPATNSLEGCDSTTELLPPTRLARLPLRRFGGQTRGAISAHQLPPFQMACQPSLRRSEGWWGGEGSNLRSR
jgi:hypothetical protein